MSRKMLIDGEVAPEEVKFDYDLFIIGAGSGGVCASRTSAGFGAKVAICELPFDPISSDTNGGVGGTCVLRGCVPKKILVYGASFRGEFEVVRWGRAVYANIQKFIQFQLTFNVAALIINVVAAVSSGEVPLNAVQLLWVNLIMDTLGALALATEPPTDHLMKRNPVGRREPLITNIMWRNLTVQALYQVVVLLLLNFGGRSILHIKQDTREHADKVKNTFIFNTFVLCQDARDFGWELDEQISFNWKKLLKNKTTEITRLNGIYKRLLSNTGVTMLEGEGKVIDAHVVELTLPDGWLLRSRSGLP